ncbi:MAG: preprotein translocase subunit YajC [Sarcina sp.]
MHIGQMLFLFAPIILIFVITWAMMIVPERKKQKKRLKMIEELRTHDKILTKGGIIAKVVKINGEELVVESEGTKIRIAKEGIAAKIDLKSEVV